MGQRTVLGGALMLWQASLDACRMGGSCWWRGRRLALAGGLFVALAAVGLDVADAGIDLPLDALFHGDGPLGVAEGFLEVGLWDEDDAVLVGHDEVAGLDGDAAELDGQIVA